MPTDRNLIKREVVTYAEVLLEAARKEDKVFEVEAQLASSLSHIRGHMEFHDVLDDSSVPGSARADVIKEVFKDYCASLVSVLAVMAERGDISLLSRVYEAYSLAAEEATGTVVVDITTAVALTDELREAVKKKLSANFGGKDIALNEHVDKTILGGIVMGAHGKRIDASVISQLENARVVLSTVPGGEF